MALFRTAFKLIQLRQVYETLLVGVGGTVFNPFGVS
jgi:hypothetical protein